MAPPPELVLFDLGGVLVELTGVAGMAELSGIDDRGVLVRRWLECSWVRAFEAGRCTPHEFARGVVDDWSLPIDGDEFLEFFAAWPTGPLAGADDLVRSTSAVVATGCLSNTNVVHWDGNVEEWPMMTPFTHRFVSHRLGLVKPDVELFDRVASSLPVPPESVLFLDDIWVNAEAARSAGFRAEHVDGVDGARRALESAGVV